MHISAAIIVKPILLNTVKHMHDIFTEIVYMAMFSRSVIRIKTIRKCSVHVYSQYANYTSPLFQNLLFKYL